MDFTNYLANRLIKATVGDVSYTAPDKVYLALYTEDPTKAGIGDSEVNQASYTRKEVTFTEPVDGVSTNSGKIEWGTATSNWGNVSFIGVLDSASSGFMLYFTALDNAKEILSGDQFIIDVNKLKLTLT
tara:strand:+ start:568 stop:954 length:387 start_codon:yes stop_codon:yes gene_type:complete